MILEIQETILIKKKEERTLVNVLKEEIHLKLDTNLSG